jgi:hypothetical protein
MALADSHASGADVVVVAPLSGFAAPGSLPAPCVTNGITGFSGALGLARTVSSPIERPSISGERRRITGGEGAEGAIGEGAFAAGSPGALGED